MIRRIKFIGIPVADQDRALEFYTQKLGFRNTDRISSSPPPSDGLSSRSLEPETGVALFTPPGHEERVGTFVNTSWEVDSVAKTYEELLAKG